MTADDFRNELAGLFEGVAKAGRGAMVVRSGDLHRAVGGYPGNSHRMPICCNVMFAEMVDEVLSAPASGLGASVAIEYRLPRLGRNGRSSAD